MATDLSNLKIQLETLNSKVSASEVHGFITGWVASGTVWNSASEAFAEAFEIPLEGSLGDVSAGTAVAVQAGLSDTEFGFQILLPDEAEGIINGLH